VKGRAAVAKKAASIEVHHGDLPKGLALGQSIGVDSETTGLSPVRDRLCLVQIGLADGGCHLVKFDGRDYSAPNLKAALTDPKIAKIFHFARFDVMMFKKWLGVETKPLFCTKIASKLVRTYTGAHGLKDLCKELLDVDLSKEQQSSDWAQPTLSEAQQRYAASDVLYLHDLQARLQTMLEREGRLEMARSCFDFLTTRVALDLAGWDEEDIFAH
jgi:ribonuclease D